jgi:hypothetical protein
MDSDLKIHEKIRIRHKIRNRITNKLTLMKQRYFIDLDGQLKNSIILVGAGRSGTTWISNLINYNNEFRYMFEPFHPYFVQLAEDFRPYQYLRPINQDLYRFHTISKVLTGRLRSERVDQYNRRLFSTKRLIKDIFAHLFLKWIKVHFPDIPIIVLLRHPCAVAASMEKLRSGWKSLVSPRDFLNQPELVEDYLYHLRDTIKSGKNFFENQILNWCIIHYVIFQQFKEGEIHLAFYENFCEQPEKEIACLFSFLQRELTQKGFQEYILPILKRPSRTTLRSSPVVSDGNLIDGWRNNVTEEQLYRAVEVLNIFGLNKIYGYESRPNVSAANELLRRNKLNPMRH